ncbi:LppX_LprAFG lipoprotein [Actinomadura macra]|uniref:LppX_LprAFG lipoprotein n=1 Tax=Actinomadura macra TaxID=46164 RepID=UPI000835E6B4|nr:LppX_LprAFG lipoprotein [Actinomadura macra]
MIRRIAAGTAVATGLALTLTGCLGDAGTKVDEAGKNIRLSAAQVLGRTAEKTGRTDSFRADLSMQMTGGPAAVGNVSMSGTMQYRTKPDLAYSMDFEQMSVGGQSMPGMKQVLVGRTMYMKVPALSQFGGGGAAAKPWIKISLDELGKKSGMSIDQLLQQSQQMDPVQNTKMLTASKDVREVGKETVNGVQTTHYTGTYRLEDALSKLPAEQQQQLRKNSGRLGTDAMAFDLWVDDQQLPRKMSMKSGQTSDGTMNLTMSYHDFGKPVQVSAPPADQVADFGALMKNLSGALRPPMGT